jgi:hypothetical protein
MPIKNWGLLFLSVIIMGNNCLAQYEDTLSYRKNLSDINMVHAFINSPATNPSYTGVTEGYNLAVHTFFDKPFFDYPDHLYLPREIGGAFDFSFGKTKNNALGIIYTDAVGGATIVESYGMSYARKIRLSRKSFYHDLRLGISVWYLRRIFEWDNISFMDNIDPQYGFIYNTNEIRPSDKKSYAKFDFGLWYQNPYFFAGLSITNLNKPDLGVYGVDIKYRQTELSMGGQLRIGSSFTIHPLLNTKVLHLWHKNVWYISPGVMGSYNNILYAGVIYKHLNSLSVVAGTTIYKRFIVSAFCGLPASKSLATFGSPAYIGGGLRTNINP